jgi:phospholipid transport system substrate-binding protein
LPAGDFNSQDRSESVAVRHPTESQLRESPGFLLLWVSEGPVGDRELKYFGHKLVLARQGANWTAIGNGFISRMLQILNRSPGQTDRCRAVARSRRAVLRDAAVLLPLALPLVVPRGGHAEDQSALAAAFIRQAGADLADIGRRTGAEDDRRIALKAFLDRVLDTLDLARFCLGRFWTSATPERQEQYVALFNEVILLNVLGRLDTYKDGASRVVVGHARPAGDAYEVPTAVSSDGQPTAHITWLVSFATGSPRIVDVSAEGISLRVTLRSDFTSYLRRANDDFAAFLDAMRRIIGSYGGVQARRP